MKNWLLIFIGGGIGSLCRYLLSRWSFFNIASGYPFFGTFIVNVSGCFLIGFFMFYFTGERFGNLSLPWRLFLVTGICGGYTTFSSFSLENIELLSNNQVLTFFTYTFGSLLLGMLATYTGILLARTI